MGKKNGNPDPRTGVEVCPRADGSYLTRFRFWGIDMRTVFISAEGLACVDVDLTPEQIREFGAACIAGAELPRPDPGKMPKPPKTGSKR